MIQQLIDALSQSGCELTDDQIADSLWLSLHLPRQFPVAKASPEGDIRNTARRDSKSQNRPGYLSSKPTTERDSPRPNNAGGQTLPTTISSAGSLFVPDPRNSGSEMMAATPLRVPTAESLPDKYGINTALRPLKRRYPSNRANVFDVTATVEQIANGGPFVPLLKPMPERWLDVALVIDESSSMIVWRETLREFALLLARHGSFRDVRCWYINSDSSDIKLYSEPGLSGAPRRIRSPKELIDASGRRLILVASDCASPGWRDNAMGNALRGWARRGPLALVQVLPERLWSATALGGTSLQFHAYSPGAPNTSLQSMRSAFLPLSDPTVGAAQSESVPLPVFNLEGWSVDPWAKLVANVGTAVAEGVTIEQLRSQPPEIATLAGRRINREPHQPSAELSARDKVARFRSAASPAARRLAGYLSFAPLFLPVMRLVQKAMMPTARQVDLAEVLLGGLIAELPKETYSETWTGIFYEFLPGVRTILQESVSETDQQTLLLAVSRLIANSAGSSIEFTALLALEGETIAALKLYPVGQKFAEINQAVIEKLSGAVSIAKPPVVPLRVLVVGTGTYELPKEVELAASRVGSAVASVGADLIVGGWRGVDHIAARAFVDTQRELNGRPTGKLMQVVEGSNNPDYPGGIIIRVPEDPKSAESVMRADLVVLVGGVGGTWDAFQQALELKKPVLPLLNTGSDARRAATLINIFGQYVPSEVIDAKFANETEARHSQDRLEILLAGLQSSVSKLQPPQNTDLLWFVETILPLAMTYMRKKAGFDIEAGRILDSFERRALRSRIYEQLVVGLRNFGDPAWRNIAYLLIQANPNPLFIEPHLSCLDLEMDLSVRKRETRPLWRWLVATNALMDRYPSEIKQQTYPAKLATANQVLRTRKDVDPDGQCKELLARIRKRLAVDLSGKKVNDLAVPQRFNTSTVVEADAGDAKMKKVVVAPSHLKKAVSASSGRASKENSSQEAILRKSTAAKKMVAKKAVAKKTAAKKTPAKRVVAKKVPTKKAVGKKSTMIRRAAKK